MVFFAPCFVRPRPSPRPLQRLVASSCDSAAPPRLALCWLRLQYLAAQTPPPARPAAGCTASVGDRLHPERDRAGHLRCSPRHSSRLCHHAPASLARRQPRPRAPRQLWPPPSPVVSSPFSARPRQHPASSSLRRPPRHPPPSRLWRLACIGPALPAPSGSPRGRPLPRPSSAPARASAWPLLSPCSGRRRHQAHQRSATCISTCAPLRLLRLRP